MRSKVVFCLVRERTDQIDAFTRRYQLSDHCLGDDRGTSACIKSRCEAREQCHSAIAAHPPMKGGSAGGVFAPLAPLTNPRDVPRSPRSQGKQMEGNASQAPHERYCLFCLSLRIRGAMVEHAKCGRTKTGYGVNYAWILYTPLFSIILLFIPALTL